MSNETKTIQEIHEIRAKLHEETKNMTPGEHTAHYRYMVEEAVKKYDLKLKRPVPSLHDTTIQ